MKRQPPLDIFDILFATETTELFAPWFKDRDTWQAWFSFLASLFALPMSAEQAAIYQKCTNRTDPPMAAAKEAWLVVGRRGGKSFILALIAVFVACFRDYRSYLGPGERGTVMVIATDKKQARITLRYIRALLKVPMLAAMVQRESSDGFDLDNSITIEVHVASFKSTRGYAICCALLDEIGFFSGEGAAEPDVEVIAALRPGMAQFPNALLLGASSPYGRRGALWDAYHKHFGKDGPVLVWQAPTRTMNPSISQEFIDAEMARDPVANDAEYYARFRSDLAAYVSRDVVMAVVADGVYERPPMSNTKYHGFCDMSGGSADAAVAAVAHTDSGVAVLDCIREMDAPHSPEAAAADFARMFKSYGISTITGDRYAGAWPTDTFHRHGIAYEPSAKVKNDLYISALPLLNSGKASLLDHPRLINQLCRLERQTSRGGRDSIDHPRKEHDDTANAVCGALLLAQNYKPRTLLMGVPQGADGFGHVIQVDPLTFRPLPPPKARVIARNYDETGHVVKERRM